MFHWIIILSRYILGFKLFNSYFNFLLCNLKVFLLREILHTPNISGPQRVHLLVWFRFVRHFADFSPCYVIRSTQSIIPNPFGICFQLNLVHLSFQIRSSLRMDSIKRWSETQSVVEKRPRKGVREEKEEALVEEWFIHCCFSQDFFSH